MGLILSELLVPTYYGKLGEQRRELQKFVRSDGMVPSLISLVQEFIESSWKSCLWKN